MALGIIVHAIRAGEALQRVHDTLPYGTWEAWLRENFHATDTTARIYMRFAQHKAELKARGINTYDEALHLVRQIAAEQRPTPEQEQRRRREAAELHKDGMSYSAIAKRLGTHGTTIRRWLLPGQFASQSHRKRLVTNNDLEHARKLLDRSLVSAQRARERACAPGIAEQLAHVVTTLEIAVSQMPST